MPHLNLIWLLRLYLILTLQLFISSLDTTTNKYTGILLPVYFNTLSQYPGERDLAFQTRCIL